MTSELADVAIGPLFGFGGMWAGEVGPALCPIVCEPIRANLKMAKAPSLRCLVTSNRMNTSWSRLKSKC